MSLPEDIRNITQEVSREGLLVQLIEQLNKDARLIGLQLDLDTGMDVNALFTQLYQWITALLSRDPGKVVDLLYRIDIPENIFKNRLDAISVEEVVELLIRRTWQKVRFRNRTQ